MKTDQLYSLALMIEAILIILCLLMGAQTRGCLIGYWCLVAVHHLTTYLTGRYSDGPR